MTFFGSIALILNFLIQADGLPSFSGDIFNPKEKAKMERANSIDSRIKIYETASKRIQKDLHGAVSKDKFEIVPYILKMWTLLLTRSLEDIEANLKSKKKSRNLIKYEIQVRKAIAATQDYKIKAPINQQDVFDSCLAQAETIRKKFVDILFQY